MSNPQFVKTVTFVTGPGKPSAIVSYDLYADDNRAYAFLTLQNTTDRKLTSLSLNVTAFDAGRKTLAKCAVTLPKLSLRPGRTQVLEEPLILPLGSVGFTYDVITIPTDSKKIPGLSKATASPWASQPVSQSLATQSLSARGSWLTMAVSLLGIVFFLVPFVSQENAFSGITGTKGSTDSYDYELLNATDCKLVLYKGDDYAVSVPSMVGGHIVKSIGDYAFSGKSMTSFALEGPGIAIGNYAFQKCRNLQSVDLGSATSIGEHAFEGCSSLASLTLAQATTIQDAAFQDDTALASVTLGSPDHQSLTLGKDIFANCPNLQTASFYGPCDSLEGLFADSPLLADLYLQSLDDMTLSDLFGKQSTKVPLSLHVGHLKSLPTHFSTGYSLASLEADYFEGSSIDKEAFLNTSALAKVTFHSVGSYVISAQAFSGCQALTDYDFSGVTSVGSEAFRATGLREVTLPSCLSTLAKDCFDDTSVTRIYASNKGESLLTESDYALPVFAYTSDSELHNPYQYRLVDGTKDFDLGYEKVTVTKKATASQPGQLSGMNAATSKTESFVSHHLARTIPANEISLSGDQQTTLFPEVGQSLSWTSSSETSVVLTLSSKRFTVVSFLAQFEASFTSTAVATSTLPQYRFYRRNADGTVGNNLGHDSFKSETMAYVSAGIDPDHPLYLSLYHPSSSSVSVTFSDVSLA